MAAPAGPSRATWSTARSPSSGPTTVSAGALLASGSIANSAVSVNSGAMLAGTSTVSAITSNAGGIFAPGATGTPDT
jgi:hypothetical protein